MAAKPYGDVDPYVLKALPNPGGAIELKHKAPEVTFLGAQDQPDFGTLSVTFYPSETVIELRSLKEYLYQWRDTAVSYERFLDVVYDHLMHVYEPLRLRLVFETRPRGGISSKLTIDSDWAIRGGKEQFRDWSAWMTPGSQGRLPAWRGLQWRRGLEWRARSTHQGDPGRRPTGCFALLGT
jgi:7-cyano-7-deazaguanine reductase